MGHHDGVPYLSASGGTPVTLRVSAAHFCEGVNWYTQAARLWPGRRRAGNGYGWPSSVHLASTSMRRRSRPASQSTRPSHAKTRTGRLPWAAADHGSYACQKPSDRAYRDDEPSSVRLASSAGRIRRALAAATSPPMPARCPSKSAAVDLPWGTTIATPPSWCGEKITRYRSASSSSSSEHTRHGRGAAPEGPRSPAATGASYPSAAHIQSSHSNAADQLL